MLNFYKIVKENLSFNRFEFRETICLEYNCPLDADQIGIFSRNDYVVHVLSGKKTYKTINGKWTLTTGQTLYLKKGAEIIHQYFDDEYCMLGFFLSDELICETFEEIKSQLTLGHSTDSSEFSGVQIQKNNFLEGFFYSMLTYFRGDNKLPDEIIVFKLKELLISLMKADPLIAGYFKSLNNVSKPSLHQIMENNYCFNLKLEDYAELCHRSLSTFKRDFKKYYHESPGKWLVKRRVKHAANLIANSEMNITEVAFESGFEDLSHFSRVFKKELGSSPTEYKKSVIST